MGNDISQRADINTTTFREAGEELYGDMVKAVIDLEKECGGWGRVTCG